MVTEYPNLGHALRTHLRADTVLIGTGYLNNADSIFVGWPRNKDQKVTVPPYSNMILILTGRGGDPINMGVLTERVDIQAFGENPAMCKKLWRRLDYYLMQPSGRVKTSFTENSCRVSYLVREGGPVELEDETASNWPYVNSTYMCKYSIVGVMA